MIETPQTILRPLVMGDAKALLKISSDPEVMRYITGGVQNDADVRRFIQGNIDLYRKKNYCLMAVLEKMTRQLIGFCGLIDQKLNGKCHVELGYRLARSHWHRNIATETAKTMKAYAFNRLKLPHIISIIQPGNQASRRVAEKIGMVEKAQWVFHGCDVVIYHCNHPAQTADSF